MTDSDSDVTDGRRPTRRRVLALTAVGATGFAGLASAQDQEGQGSEQTPQGQPTQTFRLGGEVQGWQGEQPQAIQGQANPPLSVQPGQMYELTWENLDGQPHNFAFRDEQGNDLAVILPPGAGATGNATAGNATDGRPAGQRGNQTDAAAQNDSGGGDGGGNGDADIQIQPGGDSIEDPSIGGPRQGNQTENQTGTGAGGATDNQTGAATDDQTGAPAGNQTGNVTAADGDDVQVPEGAISRTETVREQGATQTFRFVATREMVTYICPIHPTTMEGPVQIQQEGQEEEGDPGTGGRPEPQPQE